MRNKAEIVLSALLTGISVSINDRIYKLFKQGDHVVNIMTEGEVADPYWLGVESVVQHSGSPDRIAYVGSCMSLVEFLELCEQLTPDEIGKIVSEIVLNKELKSECCIKEAFIQDSFGNYCYYDVTKGKPPTIYNLYVYPKFRRQGMATKLLSSVIDIIRKTGYAGDILIEANPRENSISWEDLKNFYEKMGLKVLRLN